jgi:parallel beta-helix repeat protein
VDCSPAGHNDATTTGGGATLELNSVRLDMDGHTLTCFNTSNNGIELTAAVAQLLNGTVTGCADGVELAGTGKHAVKHVTATGNNSYGFFVAATSNNSILAFNTASNNSLAGFYVQAGKTKLTQNTASTNGEDGFLIDGLDNNKLTANTASNNASDGFSIFGKNTKVVNNIADSNDRDGFDTNSGEGHARFLGNRATNNDDNGFVIGTSNNKVVNNTATGNGADESGDGFLFQGGSFNIVKSNEALNNGDDGISLDGASSNNRLKHNTATGNTHNDLQDDNVLCDGNIWDHNIFVNSNQACAH